MSNTKKTWQGHSTKRRNSAFFLFVFLGMLTAFGPFVTDMYLPSLPAMTAFFNASTPQVQLGLTFSMLGLAAGQILFGPLSDKYGRRLPLLISLWLFLGATLGCIWAPGIWFFVLLRFVQGCAGMFIGSVLVWGALLGGANIWLFEGLLFALLFMMGLSLTAATTLAMDSVRQQAGTGSALLGACGFLFGSIVSPLVGMGNMLFTTGLVLVLCAIGSGVCALWVRQKTTAANTANVCA